MDLSNEDLVQEIKQVPPLKVQSLDSFLKKYRMLNKRELQDVLKVSIKEILDIMSESIDCVGCRRRLVLIHYFYKHLKFYFYSLI